MKKQKQKLQDNTHPLSFRSFILLYKAIEGISFKDFAKIKSYYLNCLETGNECFWKFVFLFNFGFISRIETFRKYSRECLQKLTPNHHVKIYIY